MLNKKIAIVAVFIWIGFVGAISFMEAWLKFKAPGVTLPIGLGIGRLVFAALNKVEWILLLTLTISIPFKKMSKSVVISYIVINLILITQSVWLLPALDARAELYITHAAVTPSQIHLYYVVAEILKMTGLIILGIKLLRTIG